MHVENMWMATCLRHRNRDVSDTSVTVNGLGVVTSCMKVPKYKCTAVVGGHKELTCLHRNW